MDMEVNNNKNLDIFKSKLETEKDKEKLMKTCQELEGEFVKIMFKEMKKTVPKDSLVEKSSGREIFEDLYNDELANESTKKSSLGLAKMLYDQFTKTNAKK